MNFVYLFAGQPTDPYMSIMAYIMGLVLTFILYIGMIGMFFYIGRMLGGGR